MFFYEESPDGDIFVFLLTLYFLFNEKYNLIDEEINVLFIGILCLRTLEVLIFDAVDSKQDHTRFSTLTSQLLRKNINRYLKKLTCERQGMSSQLLSCVR